MAKPRMLKIASNLNLPLEIITETVAFMGKKRSGKTRESLRSAAFGTLRVRSISPTLTRVFSV